MVKVSHHFLLHPDGRTTVVPVHSGESLRSGLLEKILRDVVLSRSGLEELLAMAERPANKPFEWTGRHLLSASPPQAPCLPLKGSVRRIGGRAKAST